MAVVIRVAVPGNIAGPVATVPLTAGHTNPQAGRSQEATTGQKQPQAGRHTAPIHGPPVQKNRGPQAQIMRPEQKVAEG